MSTWCHGCGEDARSLIMKRHVQTRGRGLGFVTLRPNAEPQHDLLRSPLAHSFVCLKAPNERGSGEAIVRGNQGMEREDDDEVVSLDESFFINDNYQLTTFTFGSQVLQLLCLQSASTDYDLTGQLVWPGAMLLNNYLSTNAGMLQGSSVIELGSGVGITGLLCSRFCREVILTDHNEEVLKILKKNVEFHTSSDTHFSAKLAAEKLEWSNSNQMNQILRSYPRGFDLVLGADIYQSSIPLLFDTVEQILHLKEERQCKFILAYVSRAKVMDRLVLDEAVRHGMQVNEVKGTRAMVGNLEGVIFEITLQSNH